MLGVDVRHYKRYPYEQLVKDVFELTPEFLSQFHIIHASPPCQIYSSVNNLTPDAVRVDYIPPARDLIYESLKLNPEQLYIIENVGGAPLIDPIQLCGASLGLMTYRHRYFETNFEIVPPPHIPHIRPQADMGHRPLPFEFMQVMGITSDVVTARQVMGIPWMTGEELSEAIPPAYTSYIGSFARTHLDRLYSKKPLFSGTSTASR